MSYTFAQQFPDQWFATYDNIVMLVRWLADNNYKADNIAHAVEKPWKYENEFLAAKHDLDELDLMEVTEQYEDFDEDRSMEELIIAKAAANEAKVEKHPFTNTWGLRLS